MTDKMVEVLEAIHKELVTLRQDLTVVRQLTSKGVNAMMDAESEIPEKMRRFIMYMHDVHDVLKMYQEVGQEPPQHVKDEAQRCDDRYRQILIELHTDGGTFEKVRREMATDPENRWDYTRRLTLKGGVSHEAGPSDKPNGS